MTCNTNEICLPFCEFFAFSLNTLSLGNITSYTLDLDKISLRVPPPMSTNATSMSLKGPEPLELSP